MANSRVIGSGCFEWTGSKHTKGYGRLQIDGHKYATHRLSYLQHRGEIPAGMHVCHTCDNPACINPTHLFLGTNADNMADMVAKGRQNKCKGERNGRAKLIESTVIAIRGAEGTYKQIAERFGVAIHQVADIRGGRSWKHLGAQNGSY